MHQARARDVTPLDGPLLRTEPMLTLEPVHRRFGGKVQPLVGELRHELLRRQTRVPQAVHDCEDLSLFGGAERVARALRRSAALIVALGRVAPALDGSRRESDHPACRCKPCTRSLRLGEELEDHFSFSSSVFSSSSAEYKASTFFLRMSKAAASARAFSFRASSRSSCLMRFVVAIEEFPSSCRAERHRSSSPRVTSSRARDAVSCSPSSSAVAAKISTLRLPVHVRRGRASGGGLES